MSPGRTSAALRLPRNDVRQYEGMADQWWQPYGTFAMLHWIAAARAELLPPAPRPGALLVDLGCGAGLLAPHAARLGYRHVGVDLVPVSLRIAAEHGVRPVRGDVQRLPLADGWPTWSSAGEILEHVPDLAAAVAEACRVLRPGGTLVLDTIANTRLARLVTVTIAERHPGRRPAGHPRPGAVRRPGPAGRRGRPARRAADADAACGPPLPGHGAVAGPPRPRPADACRPGRRRALPGHGIKEGT